MALSKDVTLPNGVTVTYHRIVTLTVFTNVSNLIEVCSYTTPEKREEERAALASDDPRMDVYMHTRVYEAPYDQTMTVADAYGYLKTLDDFEGASDVPDDGSADQPKE